LLESNWRELPTISPQLLKISRKIRYTFSGNLDKKVFTNPFFPGTEAHLLKCQLVRIGFTCNLVPRTMYNVNAEDKKEI
jgi:radial spoke head protein 4A